MKKLFSIFCCLLLSASMVTQAQLLDAGSDSSESKKIPQRANLLKERNNAPQTDWYTYWLYADDSKMNTNGYGYLGALGSVKVYRYQWDSDLQIYFAFTDNSATWTSPISGATCVMPARGSYTVTDNNPSDHVIGGKNTSWDGKGTRSRYVEDGTSFYFNSATWYVEEGVDGPYIYTTNLTLRYIYNSRFYDPLGYSVAFKIGEPAVYKSVTVQSESTTKGTVSKSMKSGYVYTTNFTDWKEGSTYTITATPNSGYRFVRWEKNGSQISTTATTDVVIDGDATYTAYFESMGAPQYTITVQTATPDYCTVSGGGTYYAGTNVTISSASKNEHLYIFDQFMLEGEDEDQGEPSFNITVTGNATYTAYYRLANSGTITAATNNASYGTASVSLTGSQPGGTAVTLTATPYGGYAFAGWDDNNDGTVDNTDNPRTVYVDGDKEYVAKFIVETASYASFSFDNPNDDIQIGKITQPSSMCQTEFYPYGISLVEIIAKNTTRTSKNYLQMYVKTNNFRTYNPVSGGSYYGPAYGTYSVSVPSEYGPVIGNCDNSIYESNYYFVYTGDATDVVIGYKVETASHGGTCHFQGYEGTLSQRLCVYSSYGADYSNETRSNFATFNNGTITVAEGAGGHPYITIRIGGTLVASIGAPAQPYTLAWDANGGELSGTYTAAGDYEEGAAITAPTATRTGYTFTGWSPAFTGTMPASDVTYVAQWELNTYTVTFKVHDNSTGFGTLQKNSETPTTEIVFTGVPHNTAKPSSAGGNALSFQNSTITPIPAEAADGYTYAFQGWNGATSKITSDKTISARFTRTATEYTITYNNYDISTYPGTLTTIYTVETQTITLPFAPNVAKEGYTFGGWYDNEELTGTPVTSIAQGSTGNKEFWAKWEQKTYTVTIAVDETNNYGTVSATSIAGVPHGATITVSDNTITINGATVTATAADADDLFTYSFSAWKNGETTLTGNSNTVTEAMTITAHFARNLKDDITLNDMEDAEYYNNFATTYDSVEVGTVTYNRTFTANRWSTICLPFDAPLVSPLKGNIFEFQHATGNANVGGGIYLYFSTATQIVAGRAYLVRFGKAPVSNSYTFYDVEINTSADKNTLDALVAANTGENANQTEGTISLIGTLRKFVLPTPSIYYMALYNNKIYYPGTNTTVPAYRAFFYDSNPSGVQQRVRIVVDGVDMGEMLIDNGELLDADKADDRAPRKYIRNGVLVIECNGVIYDAQGKRM